MLNMGCCSSRIRKRNWLFLFSSLLNYALSLIVIAVHRFRQVFESAHLLLSSMSLPLSLSPLSHDVNYRFWMSSSSNYSGADLLFFLSFPLYININIYVFVCPSAIANMEVSMSLVYLKENKRINEGCFVCKTIYSIRNIDRNVEVIIDNCITRTMTLYLSLTLFHLLTFSAKNIQARQSSICLIISNIDKMRGREKEQFVIVLVRLLALEQEKKKTLEVTLGILCWEARKYLR